MTRADTTSEPTEAECVAAQKWVQDWFTDESLAEESTSGLLARVLASQRAEIHRRYEAVAARCDREAESRRPFAAVDPAYRNTIIPYEAVAEWIRQVATS